MKAPAFIACLFFLSGCAHLASVKITAPRLPAAQDANEELAAARDYLRSANRKKVLAALGNDLSAARVSYAALQQRPDDNCARSIYNFAVARTVEDIERANLEPWRRSTTVVVHDGSYTLASPRPMDRDHDPSRYELIPADTLTISGKFLRTRATVAGIGAPLVAAGRQANPNSASRFTLARIYAPVTALLEFRGKRADLRLIDPLQTECVSLGNKQAPLAADFTASAAVAMTREHPEKLGFSRLLHPEKSADAGRLMRLQPYDPKRIPVIFVHGLGDSFVTWAPMVNTLRANPEIRRRYQFWIYSYPSGYPYPYSAALLRQELDAVARTFPHHKGIVLIGHSMGGLISRLLVTDAGDKIWRDLFGKSPAETEMSPESRKLMEAALIFNHRSDIKRVIFICAPHRGSNYASSWIGRLGTALVRLPHLSREVPGSVFSQVMVQDRSAARLTRMPSSIDTLSPRDRFVRAMNEFSITPGIPFHTIEGDRGRGDAPHSSDGVVPYWSSHLEGAQSELIVPSHHPAQRHPEAIAEVARILTLHR